MANILNSLRIGIESILSRIDGEGSGDVDDGNNDLLEEPSHEVIGFCHICGAERFIGDAVCYNCHFSFSRKTKIKFCPKCGTRREPDAEKCENCNKAFVRDLDKKKKENIDEEDF